MYNIGTWLGTQRQLLRKNLISKDHSDRLQELADKGCLTWGPVESKLSQDSARWNLMFGYLLRFQEEYKHCNVPQHYIVNHDGNCVTKDGALSGDNDLHLGQWLGRQRQYWRSGTIPADRKEKLKSLVDTGALVMNTVAVKQDVWMQHYFALLDYRQTHGHCNVPHNYVVMLSAHNENCEINGEHDNQEDQGDLANQEIEEDQNGKISQEKIRNTLSCGSAKKTIVNKEKLLKLGAWLNNQRHALHGVRNRLRPERLSLLQVAV